jgi:dihydrofolate reductase
MGKVTIGMTISVDGFVNNRNGSVGSLYPDLAELGETDFLKEEIRRTGAVVMGRRSYEMAQGDLTGYEFQVPIFVVTHIAPEKGPKGQNEKLSVTFVTDGIESAIAKARVAAGDKDVTVVGGADTTQQIIKAGLFDEIQLGIMPVMLGQGLPLFAQLAISEIKLEKVGIVESGAGRTDLKYRVLR